MNRIVHIEVNQGQIFLNKNATIKMQHNFYISGYYHKQNILIMGTTLTGFNLSYQDTCCFILRPGYFGSGGCYL